MRFGDWLKRLPPPGMLVVIYATFILIGTVALLLPICQTETVSWTEALFTATSAVTVTGLVVVDTGTTFSFAGELVISLLIQLGGLGLMTFAVLVLMALGIQVGIPQRMILREDLSQAPVGALNSLIKLIIAVALIFEAAGTLFLATVFVPEFGLWQGLWQAAFHAISAFNNAGFSLFETSLIDYATNPVINLVVPLLFIIGGLGFVVLADIWQKRSWMRLDLHSKLMLAGTPVLIVFGWVFFIWLEWTNPDTLAAFDSGWERIMVAWFQAVTPRTAGFNTIDTAAMEDSTSLLTIGLMLVGGGSASTAGGIKVTTAIVMIMGTVAFFKRSSELAAFNRALGPEEVAKVMALTAVSILVVFTGLFVVTLTNDGDFMLLAFEVVSAFGTVGLSLGATDTLDGLGLATITVIMFLGRVGPLALGFFLATQGKPRVRYPHGKVYLG